MLTAWPPPAIVPIRPVVPPSTAVGSVAAASAICSVRVSTYASDGITREKSISSAENETSPAYAAFSSSCFAWALAWRSANFCFSAMLAWIDAFVASCALMSSFTPPSRPAWSR